MAPDEQIDMTAVAVMTLGALLILGVPAIALLLAVTA
jgi:hypothetical protein